MGAGASAWRLKHRREGEAGDGLGEIELTSGPGLSAGERERGGRGSRLAGGPRPRKREGAWGGSGPKGRKEREGGRERLFFFQ